MRRLAAALVLTVTFAAPVAAFRDCERCPEMVELPNGLAIGRTEVTFDEWLECVTAGACREVDDHGWGRGRRPVVNVTLADVEGYARWLSGRAERACRLPTEAEWEEAARAGTATAYWWGDRMEPGRANCRECDEGPIRHETLPVASYPANPWGLHDTAGNVWEWTSSCWDQACRRRAVRGGAWYYFAPAARSASRAGEAPEGGGYAIGFRLVCALRR